MVSNLAEMAEAVGPKIEPASKPAPKSAPKAAPAEPRPEPKPTPKRASANTAAALSTLDDAYNLLNIVLLMAGAHKAAGALSDSLPGLMERNEKFLNDDPELAKKIASVGKKGGRAAFIGAQVMTLAPVAVLAMAEIRERSEKKREEASENDFSGVPAMVGGIPID